MRAMRLYDLFMQDGL